MTNDPQITTKIARVIVGISDEEVFLQRYHRVLSEVDFLSRMLSVPPEDILATVEWVLRMRREHEEWESIEAARLIKEASNDNT